MKALLLLPLLVLLAAPQDDATIRSLIERLDDDSIDVRTRSGAALTELGARAAPALKAALEGSSGEFRERLLETLRRIRDRERLAQLLPAPSLVTIEADRRPLRDVFKRLSRQTRTPIDYSEVPENAVVSVSLDGVPFWKALDHICRTSGQVLPEVENERVVIRPEKYVALPGRTTDRFRLTLESVELTNDGSFGETDRSERFGATLRIAWEKGVRPFRVSATLIELVDEHGKDIVAGEEEEPQLTTSIGSEAIRQDFVLSSSGPGPAASRLERLKAAFELEFPLKSSTVAFDLVSGKFPETQDCAEFSATLVEFRKVEGVVMANVAFVIRPPLMSIVAPESIFLRDRDGREYPANAQSSSGSDSEPIYQLRFPSATEQGAYTQLVVRVPSEVHRERIELDLKDVPLK